MILLTEGNNDKRISMIIQTEKIIPEIIFLVISLKFEPAILAINSEKVIAFNDLQPFPLFQGHYYKVDQYNDLNGYNIETANRRN